MRPRRLTHLATTAALLITGLLITPSTAHAAAAPPSSHQRVQAGPITLDLSIDAATINVAQSLTATLTVFAPADVECTLPRDHAPGAKLGTWTIVSVSDAPPKASIDPSAPGLIFVRRLTLEPFLAGDYEIPALDVAWKSRTSGASGIARTEPVKTTVTSLLPARKPEEKPDPKDLDPGTLRDEFIASSTSRHRLLAVGGTLVAVCLFGLIGARWVTRRRTHRRDPVDAAFALVSASRDVPRDAAALGLACDDFAAALRTAIADRIDPAAASMTPAELGTLASLRACLPDARATALTELLEQLDALRFSGSVIPAGEFESLRGTATDLIGSLHALPRRREGGAA